METIAQEESTWKTECIIGAGRRLPGEKAGPQHTELGGFADSQPDIFFVPGAGEISKWTAQG